MIDFTSAPKKKKAYGGANGNKISIVYEGDTYMLKLPTHVLRNANLSYTNSAISDDGSRINYYVFLSSHKYRDCDEALRRIAARIDLGAINQLIDDVEILSHNHKTFLKLMIKLRFQKLILANMTL